MVYHVALDFFYVVLFFDLLKFNVHFVSMETSSKPW